MKPLAIFWVRCQACQHVESAAERPDRCPRCESYALAIVPICPRAQKRIERREAWFARLGRNGHVHGKNGAAA